MSKHLKLKTRIQSRYEFSFVRDLRGQTTWTMLATRKVPSTWNTKKKHNIYHPSYVNLVTVLHNTSFIF